MGANGSDLSEVLEFWEDLYRGRPQVWSGDPHPVFAAVAGELETGSALDLDPEDWEVVPCETASAWPRVLLDGCQQGTLSDGIVQVRRRPG